VRARTIATRLIVWLTSCSSAGPLCATLPGCTSSVDVDLSTLPSELAAVEICVQDFDESAGGRRDCTPNRPDRFTEQPGQYGAFVPRYPPGTLVLVTVTALTASGHWVVDQAITVRLKKRPLLADCMPKCVTARIELRDGRLVAA
jgi:hypothetical protein